MATSPPGADPTVARKQLQGFADLIAKTRDGLRAVGAPSQLSGAVDDVIADWERIDADFASVLRDLKGQAWSMQADHLRAVREKLVQHLDANLGHVNAQLAQLRR